MSIKRALLWLCVVLGTTAQAQQIDITTQRIAKEGDSIVIKLRIKASHMDIASADAVVIQPLIGDSTQQNTLPGVVYCGTQRYRVYQRIEAMQPANTAIEPYYVYQGVKKDQTYVFDYRAALLHQPWMEGAWLKVERATYDCCNRQDLGSQVLVDNIRTIEPPRPVVPQPWRPALALVPQMVLRVAPKVETVKSRTETVAVYIAYKKGSSVVYPQWGNNSRELTKVDDMIHAVTGNALIVLNKINITGFSSPDGTYAGNDKLAKNRALGFEQYMHKNYQLKQAKVYTDWVAEDWDGLVKLLHEYPKDYADQVLAIIAKTSQPDLRENKLKLIDKGEAYKDMLDDLFPRLRRIQLKADYVIKPVPTDQLRATFDTHPQLLSLEEMYRIAPNMDTNRVAYQQFYETAARCYPTDFVANNAAAVAALCNTDTTTAARYLQTIATDPRSYVNTGVLYYIKGNKAQAQLWFTKAANAGIEQGAYNLNLITSTTE